MTASPASRPLTGYLSSRWLAVIGVLVAVLAGLAIAGSGAGLGVERSVAAAAAGLRGHPASGRLHIVEIDARSIVAIDRWPWSRAQHAAVIDRLRVAGVEAIAFDVDFSSRSDAAGDRALAAAIRRADGRVILPTFRQASGSKGETFIDALPAPALREGAALAAVSVRPDGDGQVREAPIGTITAGSPRPSLSAMLAGRAGQAGASFPIDYAIDPATIPRHSFVDIRDGRFDPAVLAGKQVLIGATAVELGDRYAVPNHGVIPGVVIQALAAETLFKGVPGRIGWPVALILAAGLAALLMRMTRRSAVIVLTIAAPATLFALVVAGQAGGQSIEVAPALACLVIAICIAWSLRAAQAWQRRRAQDAVTGLPNALALAEAVRTTKGATVFVARLGDYERLAAGLSGEGTGQLVRRICDRIRLGEGRPVLHRIDDRMIGWLVDGGVDRAADCYAQLRSAMGMPVEVDGRRIDVLLTLGVAEAGFDDPARAIAHGALAAEQAHNDSTGWHVYHADQGQIVDRELSLLGELDDAVARGELSVLYQPKLDIAAGRIASVEALVRWHHPTLGALRPDQFIPLAERNDRIAGLTLFVIERTLADMAIWGAAGHPIAAAVNLSAKLLTSTSFNAALLRLLARHDIAPEQLIFEVTESAAMTDFDRARAALAAFRTLGIGVSMDDYGTGQSTLSYLKQLPLTELKIDRSFVQYAHSNRGDAILVRSTIDLAHELGLKVVAEGVEDQACLDFLASVGCDMAQGYLIARPIPSGDVLAMLGDATALAA